MKGIIMKKMYIQPEMEISNVRAMTLMGGSVIITPDPHIGGGVGGGAPARRGTGDMIP